MKENKSMEKTTELRLELSGYRRRGRKFTRARHETVLDKQIRGLRNRAARKVRRRLQ